MEKGHAHASHSVVQALPGLEATDRAQKEHSQLGAGRSLLHTGPRQLSWLTATAASSTWPSMPLGIQMSTHQPPAVLKMSVTASASNCAGDAAARPCWHSSARRSASACALANAAGSAWPSCNPASKIRPPEYERDGLSPFTAWDFNSKALLTQDCQLGCVLHDGRRCLLHVEDGPHRHAQHGTSQRCCSRGQQRCLHMCSAQESCKVQGASHVSSC